MVLLLTDVKLLQGTSVLVMHVEVVATLVQDLAAISEGELVRQMGMGVAVGLVMGIMDMVEGLEVSLLLFVFLFFSLT